MPRSLITQKTFHVEEEGTDGLMLSSPPQADDHKPCNLLSFLLEGGPRIVGASGIGIYAQSIN